MCYNKLANVSQRIALQCFYIVLYLRVSSGNGLIAGGNPDKEPPQKARFGWRRLLNIYNICG